MLQSDTEISTDKIYLQDAAQDAVSSNLHPEEAILGVVHDLGNLIQIATSALNIISRSSDLKTGVATEAMIANASASLHRAGSLVQQTLQLARGDRIVSQPVDVLACLTEIETLVRATWGRNIAFELYASQALPVIRCSRVGLQSALMNLLINARDAMPNGGTISLVAAAIYDGAVADIELRVSDNGFGMSKDVLRRATDPFFTTKVSGLGGLGLPMVSRFAQEAGGRLMLESQPGRGTVATLRLPVDA
jgi:signal transduction histidine kinase